MNERPLLVACDVAYDSLGATGAAVWFRPWRAPAPLGELLRRYPPAAPYRSGRLFERELPVLLPLLEGVPRPWGALIVDGYVWLDHSGSPGLGGHLFAALGGHTPVVGVAKRYRPGAPAAAVWRGRSRRPLWVSAAGVDAGWAADRVGEMHGPFRVPTLLRRVDVLARQGVARCSRLRGGCGGEEQAAVGGSVGGRETAKDDGEVGGKL